MLRVGSPVQLHSLVKQPELNGLCMEVTLVGASWAVVAGDQTGVDFIPCMKCFQCCVQKVVFYLAFPAARPPRTRLQ